MKNLVNILQKQGMQAKHNASVANAETRAMENVGKMAQNNPDIAQLLGDENVDFKALLQNMSHEDAQALVEQVNNGVETLGANQESLKAQLQAQMSQQPIVQNANATGVDATNLNQLQANPELNNLLNNTDAQTPQAGFNQPTQPQTLEALLGKNVKMNQNPQATANTTVDTSQMKQAEDSSRAFMPERKSIFEVANKNQANKIMQANTQASPQTAQVQSSNEMVNLNQFMQGQSASAKNRIVQQNYKNEQASMFTPKVETATLDGLKSNQVVNATNNEMQQGFDMSGGEMAQDSNVELIAPNNIKTASAMAAGTKVFDMSALQNANNTQDVINQIQNYIIQSKASNEQSVQMTFSHRDLGNIDLQVMKSGGDTVNIMINAQSTEGAKFFQQNQGELLQTLQNAGIQVADFKLDSSSQSNNNSNSNQDSSKQFAQQGKDGQQHEQNKKDNESSKRSELWKEYEEREMA